MRRTRSTFLLSSFVTAIAATTALAVPSSPQLPAVDRAIAGDFEDMFVVGRESGEDHEMLFGLVDVAFGPDGELYVLEERNHRVQIYGRDGDFRRTFGREGQGPGEFQLPMSLSVTVEGEVPVWDFQHRAYVVFAGGGEYVRNVGWGEWWDSWLSAPSRDSLRRWPAGGVAYLPNLLQDEGDSPEDLDRGVILHEPLGDTVAPAQLHHVHHPRRRAKEVAGVLELTNGPVFSPLARWDVVSDGRLAVADGTEYRIRIVRPESGETTILERPIPSRPVTEADRERERERKRLSYERPAGMASFGGSGGGRITPQQVRRIVDAMEFSEVISVIRDLRVDADDRLWIQRYGETYDDDGPIDIVTAAGEYVGTLPAMAMPDSFGPDGVAAWMVVGDDIEVERVIVRRLPASLR